METENLSFGKRFGYESVEFKIQIESIDENLKTDFYNCFLLFLENKFEYIQISSFPTNPYKSPLKIIWIDFLKNKLDKYPSLKFDFLTQIQDLIYKQVWYKTYELFEFIFNSVDSDLFDLEEMIEHLNIKLEQNNSAYRFIDKKFVPITNKSEIAEISKANENAVQLNILGLSKHLSQAISLLSLKPNPDLRNSIKESISMVEAVCKTIEPTESTLGKALNKIDKKMKINQVLKSSFEKLYAYSNDENGIRHAMMEDEAIDLSDARYFLISCSAFSNYLIDKAIKAGFFF